jgi:hypothetical protein
MGPLGSHGQGLPAGAREFDHGGCLARSVQLCGLRGGDRAAVGLDDVHQVLGQTP